jgi:hypothetical protein
VGRGCDRSRRGRRRGPYGLSGANRIQTAKADAILGLLTEDSRLKWAARVAREFNLDPVALLRDEGDEFLTHVRIAAWMVVQEDKRKEGEAEKSAARKH